MKLIIPEVDKHYKARVAGWDNVILKFTGPVGELHHCASCTCKDETLRYSLVSGQTNLSVGTHEIELLEEVEAPK